MKTKVVVELSVILALACSTGCLISGKSVGVEDDGANDGGEGDGTEGSGGMSDGPGGSSNGDGSAGDNDGSGDDGDCPAIAPAVPDCGSCELQPDCSWECDFSACPPCPADGCGITCIGCDNPDGCVGDWYEGECNFDGVCVQDPEPDMCGPELPAGFEDDLTLQGGCADMQVYAYSDDDTMMLVLSISDLDVNGLVEETTFSDLGVDAFTIFEVRLGSGVSQAECNDAIVPPGPQVDYVLPAVSASVDITITPGVNPTANITLSDVTLNSGAFAMPGFQSYTFTDVAVGWLPG